MSLPADGVGSEEKQNLKERSYFPSREKTVAGQNLAFSAQRSQMKKCEESLEEIERGLLFSAGREGNAVGLCLKNVPPNPHEGYRGLYKTRACRGW